MHRKPPDHLQKAPSIDVGEGSMLAAGVDGCQLTCLLDLEQSFVTFWTLSAQVLFISYPSTPSFFLWYILANSASNSSTAPEIRSQQNWAHNLSITGLIQSVNSAIRSWLVSFVSIQGGVGIPSKSVSIVASSSSIWLEEGWRKTRQTQCSHCHHHWYLTVSNRSDGNVARRE